MAENLYCMVKGCNNKDHKNLHICKKHFYKLPKEKREQLETMKVVSSMGQMQPSSSFLLGKFANHLSLKSLSFDINYSIPNKRHEKMN